MIATGVPKGYKRTEVGVVPDDWDVKYLKNISPSQSVGLVINPSTYFDNAGQVPMLVGSNVNENSIDWESAKRITIASNQSLPASRIYAGDLVMVRVGEPGVTAVVPPELDGCNCASMMIVRQHRSFNSQWLCYVMNSSAGRGQVEHVQYGTAQKQFNISDAIDFRYPVPPLTEQEEIAEALEDADAMIESLEQLVAKKRHLKQAAMQQLLTGKKRLPGFEVSEPSFRQTLVGPVPADWDLPTVGDEYDIQLGKMLDAEKNTGVSKPYLGNRAVQWGHIDVSDLSTMAMSNSDLTKFRLQDGDLLVCEGGEVGRAAIWNSTVDECYYQKAIHRLRARNGFNSQVMIAFLHKWSAERRLTNFVTQTSIAHLPKDKFVTIPLPKPSIAEQTAIAEVLSDMDDEIEAIEAKLTKARQVKQGMMQELLTGRTRLV